MNRRVCTYPEKDLVLRYYGELDPEASQEMDRHLETCGDCAQAFAELEAMEMALPRGPSIHPDEEIMEAIRAATARRIQERGGIIHSGRRRLDLRLPTSRLPRLALTAAVVALVFFAGRLTMTGIVRAPAAWPDVSNISGIGYDAETGAVSVQYRLAGESFIAGSFEDDRIQDLLQRALSDTDNPSAQLRVVKLLGGMDAGLVEPDGKLVDALVGILRNDPNQGMKLHAVGALRRIYQGKPVDARLSALLMEILDTSENSALRIVALDLLTSSELARQDLQRVLARAARDQNSFIRFKARREMEGLENAIPLDRLQ